MRSASQALWVGGRGGFNNVRLSPNIQSSGGIFLGCFRKQMIMMRMLMMIMMRMLMMIMMRMLMMMDAFRHIMDAS